MRLVSLCTITSRILGLMRDQGMAVLFGTSWISDAFTFAFRLPNLARALLGEGALTTAFLPVFVNDLHERGRDSAARLTWAVFFSLFAVMLGLIVVGESALFSLHWFGNLSPRSNLLVQLTAILLPYVALICLAAQLGAVLNAQGRFLWPALVPAILNSVWLVTLWVVVPLWSDPINQIHVTAISVLVGGTLQLLFPLPILYATGYGYRSDWRQSIDRVGKIATDMLPVVIGLSVTQLNAALDSCIAWVFTQPNNSGPEMLLPGGLHYPLQEGTATALYLGQRLYQFPLGVFGVALGTVLFPLLTLHAQRGEFDKLRSDLSLGIRLVIAIGIPASAGLMLIAHPLAVLFFQYGRFDEHSAQHTGTMIAMYASGVWAYCGLLILQRGFYAIGDRMTPMYLSVMAMFGNLILNVSLIWPLGSRGLALSTAMIAALQCAVMIVLLQRRIGRLLWSEITVTTGKTLVATLAMALSCRTIFNLMEGHTLTFGRAVRLGAPLGVGIAVFLITALIIRLSEPWTLLIGRRSLRNKETTNPGETETASQD